MKALTLRAPWGTVIAKHGKDVENRGWKPPDSIIGERMGPARTSAASRTRAR